MSDFRSVTSGHSQNGAVLSGTGTKGGIRKIIK